jgi:flagellar basal body-associated protein FliL
LSYSRKRAIHHDTRSTSLAIVITLALVIMLAATVSGASVGVSAQKNQTKTNVTPAGKQATKIINQTSIPANKTTTTIQKKTEPVGKVPLPSCEQ